MSNFNKLQNGMSSPTKTSLERIPEGSPRLSMRSTITGQIGDEVLTSIQLQQQELHNLIKSANSEAQGADLIENLTTFVGSDGLMKDSVDLEGYAQLMKDEVSSSHQLLLLKIIVATLKNDLSFSEKVIKCESLMLVLGTWLSSVEAEKLLDSVLVEKLLEIFSRLNFSVDQLVKYKFGRVIKKITQQKEKTSPNSRSSTNYQMAVKLFDDWSALASKSEVQPTLRRKSDEEIVPKPEIKIDSEVVTIQKRSSVNSVDEDDKKKAKITDSVITKSKKKRVRFPDSEAELCKVFLFERAPEEYEYLSDGSASRDSYLHADAGEASVAFQKINDLNDDINDELKPWKNLEPLDGIPNDRPEGIDSEEKIIQHQRERTVLSVNYFSLEEIPSSPSEFDVDCAEDDQSSIKIIPIRAKEVITKHNVPIKASTPSLYVPTMFNPNLFQNMIPTNTAYNSLLNPFLPTPPLPNTTLEGTSKGSVEWSPIYVADSPKYEPSISAYDYKSLKPVTSPVYNPSFSEPSKNQYNTITLPSPVYRPKSGVYVPKTEPNYDRVKVEKPKSKNENIPSKWNAYRPDPNERKSRSNRIDDSDDESYRGYSSKPRCRYYRAGKPSSCRLGSTCRFLHQD